jgi:hypothetical protein
MSGVLDSGVQLCCDRGLSLNNAFIFVNKNGAASPMGSGTALLAENALPKRNYYPPLIQVDLQSIWAERNQYGQAGDLDR